MGEGGTYKTYESGADFKCGNWLCGLECSGPLPPLCWVLGAWGSGLLGLARLTGGPGAAAGHKKTRLLPGLK